jgi:Prenyltransferase and squalene oxidase repeat
MNAIDATLPTALTNFTKWLERYGENSRDHQTFFAGPIGGRAKALYYRHRLIGTVAVAPMIFCEAFFPAVRRLFFRPVRFPIADAHFAMGFAFLYEATDNDAYFQRAIHFLEKLKESRCAGFKEYCWGYPFDWVTRNGVIKEQTPLITTTPYVFEAFLQAFQIEPRQKWKTILESIARHAIADIKEFRTSESGSSCSYTPFDQEKVINAAAYRAFLLTSASRVLFNEQYWKIAERNLNFVLESQNPDGSWYYSADGVRDFVDHFHTCFVMKALAKIHSLTGHAKCLEALRKGVKYYLKNLFHEDGLPKPFSRAPRLTVYKRELYDCAECINLCLLLRDRFPELDATLKTTVAGILKDWIKPDGSFRSRQLLLGWDNVPMHRWAQSQMFRNLAFYCYEESRKSGPKTARADTTSVESDLKNFAPQLSTLA